MRDSINSYSPLQDSISPISDKWRSKSFIVFPNQFVLPKQNKQRSVTTLVSYPLNAKIIYLLNLVTTSCEKYLEWFDIYLFVNT